MFQAKVVGKITIHTSRSIMFFLHLRLQTHTYTHTHTHSEYVILLVLQQQQRLHKRALMLDYKYIDCLVRK